MFNHRYQLAKMYTCFVCDKQSPTIRVLKMHFYKQHHFNAFSKYTCRQSDCMRDFQSSKSFFRHLDVSHTVPLQPTLNNKFLPTNNADIEYVDSDAMEISVNSDEIISSVSLFFCLSPLSPPPLPPTFSVSLPPPPSFLVSL